MSSRCPRLASKVERIPCPIMIPLFCVVHVLAKAVDTMPPPVLRPRRKSSGEDRRISRTLSVSESTTLGKRRHGFCAMGVSLSVLVLRTPPSSSWTHGRNLDLLILPSRRSVVICSVPSGGPWTCPRMPLIKYRMTFTRSPGTCSPSWTSMDMFSPIVTFPPSISTRSV